MADPNGSVISMSTTALLRAYAFNLAYAHDLVSDIAEADMYKGFGPGLENHPAFTLGHLCGGSGLIAKTLGESYDVPESWDALFRRKGPGDPRLPAAKDATAPSKAELLAELTRQHERVAAAIKQLTPEELSRPFEWRLGPRFQDIAGYLHFMCITHEACHLGQIAAWRRAAEMESSLARM